jgi:outer membrane translocation and assembly module TamA
MTGHLLLGLIRDTRDNEGDPSRGGSEELALRLARPGLGSRFRFGQATLVLRRFVPLGPRVVLGGRFIADGLFGEVPFFEWSSIGGLQPAEGIGGISSVRGITRQRYGGTVKLLGNLELRATLAHPVVFGERFKLAGVLFADGGRAWAPGVADGEWHRIHPAAGVGLRVVRGAAAVRADFGVSRERAGLYVTFGHLF